MGRGASGRLREGEREGGNGGMREGGRTNERMKEGGMKGGRE